MLIPDCYYRVSVKGLILDKQNKVLLARQDNGLWDLPGGGLEHGESFEEGLTREFKEELGLKPNILSLTPKYMWTFQKEANDLIKHYLLLVFLVKLDSLNFIPSDECLELKYFSKEDLKSINLDPNLDKFKDLF